MENGGRKEGWKKGRGFSGTFNIVFSRKCAKVKEKTGKFSVFLNPFSGFIHLLPLPCIGEKLKALSPRVKNRKIVPGMGSRHPFHRRSTERVCSTNYLFIN